MSFQKLLKISRPRFWIYLLGPFMLPVFGQFPGIALEWRSILLAALYFTLPANLLIYGVNDIFDLDTDALNPKKDNYENRLKSSESKTLRNAIITTNLPFLAVIAISNPKTVPALLAFLLLGIFYSAPPIRAKALPVIDGLFNALYVMPALVAIALFPYTKISWPLIFAGMLWCAAMHAYSAIPDITADKAAKLKTVATLLGHKATILYVTTLWVISGILTTVAINSLFPTIIIALVLYLPLLAVSWDKRKVFQAYKLFPLVNLIVGFLISMQVLGFIFQGPAI